MTNPQNTQFFGDIGNPYPLEINSFHRFLIPNFENELSSLDLELWCGGTRIACEFGVFNNKLTRVTFFSHREISGQLQIRTSLGQVLFWANCVQFINSTDEIGRKYIRIATKHFYNKNLFSFDGSNYDWIVTNLPAYCLGQFSIEAEVGNSRTGGNNTLRPREALLDEVVSYQFFAKGDANILSFIQVHSVNSQFFIDGTLRTAMDKLDAQEFALYGTMRFTNVKDSLGLNIPLDENEIFDDVTLTTVLSDDNLTVIYSYDDDYAIPVNYE